MSWRVRLTGGACAMGAIAGAILLSVLVSQTAPRPGAEAQLPGSTPPLARIVHTLKHPHAVFSVAWSPDGTQVATGGILDMTVSIWDPATGRLLRTHTDRPGSVMALAYSPDGKYLAVGRNFVQVTKPHVHIYDAASGELVRSFVPPQAPKGNGPNAVGTNAAEALAFSPDSHRFATHGYGGGAVGVVYDLSNGSVVATLAPSTSTFDAVRSLAWSPDGRWVALGRRNRLELWNSTSWKLERQRDVDRQTIHALVFSPDNHRLALGGLRSTFGEAEAREYARLPENFRRSHPAPESMPNDLFLLDPVSLSISNAFSSNHNGSFIRELAFTPDGKFLVSGAGARSVAVHEVSSGNVSVFLKDFKQPAHPALSKDGKYVAVGTGQEVRLYEITR